MAIKILVCDDDKDVLSALQLLLSTEGYQVSICETPAASLVQLKAQRFDIVLADLNYSADTTSGSEGLTFIAQLKKQDPDIPVVVMTGWGTIELAVQSMQQGAGDFIQKPWENERLLSVIASQLQLAAANKKVARLTQHKQLLERENQPKAGGLIALAPQMREVISMLERVAKTDVNVLITGENGTGKSLFARYLHDVSQRAEKEFVAVNMGAINETLFESEMFGHVKGAFTDAKNERIGRFELADKGSLFLDEVANTPLSQQGKLLRVLEEQQLERVGDSRTLTVDVRLIAATNADLTEAVTKGSFRQDLLFRLNTIEVHIPPLRERQQDIIPLAERFLDDICAKYQLPRKTLSSETKSLLLSYNWPGNIREMSHVMERAVILAKENIVCNKDLGLDMSNNVQAPKSFNRENTIDLRPIKEIEADILQQRMAWFEGNAEKAAASLGLAKSTFYRQLGKTKSVS